VPKHRSSLRRLQVRQDRVMSRIDFPDIREIVHYRPDDPGSYKVISRLNLLPQV
jgi:hypothetical protein